MKIRLGSIWLCALALSLALPALCAAVPGSIGGVIQEGGTPRSLIVGATVSVSPGSLSFTTLSDGQYSFTGLAAGTYTVTASAAGYYSKSKTVVVAEDAAATQHIVLAATPAEGSNPALETWTGKTGAAFGYTQDVNHYPWIKHASEPAASATNDPTYGDRLRLAPHAGGYGLGIGIFRPADLDFSADTICSSTSDGWACLAYRQDTAGVFNSGGYMVLWTSKSNWFQLLYNGSQPTIAALQPDPPIDWSVPHRIRVVAVGNHHMAYVDGVKLIDAYDSRRLSGGYCNVERMGANITAFFDNISLSSMHPTGTVSGRVIDSQTTEGIGGARVYAAGSRYWAVTEPDGSYTIECDAAALDTITAYETNHYSASATSVEAFTGETKTGVDIALVPLPVVAPADTVYDSFSRDDSLVLGATEDSNHYPWVLSTAETHASIAGGKLLLTGGSTSAYSAGLSLSGAYLPADFDMSVDMTIGAPAGWAGIIYRQPAAGVYGTNPQGYLLYFASDGTYARIFNSGLALVEKTFATPIDWSQPHTVRVRAIGARHEVLLDGEKILDAVNGTKLTRGYFGVFRSLSQATFDGFSITRFSTDQGQINGSVYDAGDPSIKFAGVTVSLSSGDTAVTDANGNYVFSRLPLGTYTSSVAVNNYYPKTRSIALTADSPAVVADQAMVPWPTVPSQIVFDDFDRGDYSDQLGSTSVGNIPWDTAGEDATTAGILFNKLSLMPLATHGVSLGGGFQPADFDASVEMTIDGGSWGALAYRQGKPGTYDSYNGQTSAEAGYLAYCASTGTGVSVYRNGANVATTTIASPIDWTTAHTLRVKVIGNRHQVFIDDKPYLDFTHTGKMTGGYIGVLRSNSYINADNLSVSAYATPIGTITGTITDAANPTVKLAGALIRLTDGQTVTADEQGVYTATVQAIANIGMTVWAPGHLYATVPSIEPLYNGVVVKDVALNPISAPNKVIWDTFTRPDGYALGTTEDPTHYAWQKNGETADSVSITNGKLVQTMLTGGYGIGIKTGIADLDLTAYVSNDGGGPTTGWCGISYRQDNPGDFNHGYMTYWTPDGSYVVSYYWPGSIGTYVQNVPIVWSNTHKVRLRIEGPHHQFWVDEVKYIDMYEWNRLGASNGWISLQRWDTDAVWDNISIVGGGDINPVPVGSTSAAKSAADGTMVELSGINTPVVTAVFDGCFYVEDANRTSGIKVVSGLAVEIGDAVEIRGAVTTDGSERYINALDVKVTSSDNDLAPLGMNNRASAPAVGLSSIGLLTTIWGEVLSVSDDGAYCYVDDGSGVSNELGVTGIKVIIAGSKKPVAGDDVSCTGICRIVSGGVPGVQMRSDDDLVIR